MEIYELSKSFPEEEKYSLTDQIRKSSRSVSAQIAEGWRRRKYRGAFVNKMNEALAKLLKPKFGWSIQ
jgi:four helix bundle protein